MRIEGKAACRIADPWRALLPGVLCAVPLAVFSLRFLDGGRIVCQASLCWIGNTIREELGGRSFEYGFEALDELSVALDRELP
jgi:hypothetical protein